MNELKMDEKMMKQILGMYQLIVTWYPKLDLKKIVIMMIQFFTKFAMEYEKRFEFQDGEKMISLQIALGGDDPEKHLIAAPVTIGQENGNAMIKREMGNFDINAFIESINLNEVIKLLGEPAEKRDQMDFAEIMNRITKPEPEPMKPV